MIFLVGVRQPGGTGDIAANEKGCGLVCTGLLYGQWHPQHTERSIWSKVLTATPLVLSAEGLLSAVGNGPGLQLRDGASGFWKPGRVPVFPWSTWTPRRSSSHARLLSCSSFSITLGTLTDRTERKTLQKDSAANPPVPVETRCKIAELS